MDEPGTCVFCDVVAGRAEVSLVHQDDTVMVIMDANPVNPGHVLVLPRRHLAGLEDLGDQVGEHLWRTARLMAMGLRRSRLRCEGVNIFLGDGQAAFQQILHVHLHVFPRYDGDDFVIDADCEPRERRLLNQEAWALRDAVRSVLRPPAPVYGSRHAPGP
ncbi:HIT family protein [Sphaerisporangium sp. TRM90804]|uniref:HIT family protein n=1 Tax=Sphaerisporangium sp. TRM90804 TaxID=3031113 RepID=UPI002448459F|nr:HIT family protein [Sphaerisporangium sp. TRM90804]MDH2426862.1 HIT family protein [Sphaerisporangium sp. TRM90804]